MSKQTPREQIEAIPLIIVRADGRIGDLLGKLHPSTVDAIIAVFTGLPAMQEEPPSVRRAIYRNSLRRQILAELGVK